MTVNRTARLEANPWFGFFIATNKFTEKVMTAIALEKGRVLFLSVGRDHLDNVDYCDNGHPKHYHPFANTHVCFICHALNIISRAASVTQPVTVNQYDTQEQTLWSSP